MPGPILFCYDGSEGSSAAMEAAAALLDPSDAVVLTVWETTASVLARSAPFGPTAIGDETLEEVDAKEAHRAAEAAREGVERGRAEGWEASDRVERTDKDPAHTIIAVADEIDARLIVCGRRGRGALTATLLGSVSHALVTGSGRPVLVAPEG